MAVQFLVLWYNSKRKGLVHYICQWCICGSLLASIAYVSNLADFVIIRSITSEKNHINQDFVVIEMYLSYVFYKPIYNIVYIIYTLYVIVLL